MENIRNVYPVFRPLLDNTNDCIQLIDALKQSVKHPNIEKKYNVMNTQFFPKINCFVPLFRVNNDIFNILYCLTTYERYILTIWLTNLDMYE